MWRVDICYLIFGGKNDIRLEKFPRRNTSLFLIWTDRRVEKVLNKKIDDAMEIAIRKF